MSAPHVDDFDEDFGKGVTWQPGPEPKAIKSPGTSYPYGFVIGKVVVGTILGLLVSIVSPIAGLAVACVIFFGIPAKK